MLLGIRLDAHGEQPYRAFVVFLALYTAGVAVAFATGIEWFPLPGTVLGLAYTGSWGLVQHQKLRVLHDRYEDHPRRKQFRRAEGETPTSALTSAASVIHQRATVSTRTATRHLLQYYRFSARQQGGPSRC